MKIFLGLTGRSIIDLKTTETTAALIIEKHRTAKLPKIRKMFKNFGHFKKLPQRAKKEDAAGPEALEIPV